MLLRVAGGIALAAWAVDADAREMTLMDTVTTESVRMADLSPTGEFTAVLRSIPRVPYEDDDGYGYTELALINAQGELRLT